MPEAAAVVEVAAVAEVVAFAVAVFAAAASVAEDFAAEAVALASGGAGTWDRAVILAIAGAG
jgi:hypothetical protein